MKTRRRFKQTISPKESLASYAISPAAVFFATDAAKFGGHRYGTAAAGTDDDAKYF